MEVITIDDAPVLIPNNEHKNFTSSSDIIPRGTTLIGNVRIVKGLRRGQPFEYKLFYTNNNQIIYINKIKPTNMQTTEVTLSAQGDKSETVVNIPTKTIDRNLLYGVIIGATAGFGYSAYKNKDWKNKLIYTVVCALAGAAVGKFITKNKGVTIKESK